MNREFSCYVICFTTLFVIFYVPIISMSADGCWEEVINFDPCNSPITGNTNVRYDYATGLYLGHLENESWKATVGYSGGSINEVGASCNAAIAKNPTLVCPPGNIFFNKANGESYHVCEESYSAEWWGGYWLVNEITCYPDSACSHYSTITYKSPGGSVAQIVNDHWSAISQQVVKLWKWVPKCGKPDLLNNLGAPYPKCN